LTPTTETEAIVLDSTDHGESDLILTLFSQEFGRLSAIAKGAKKSKKRFVNKLELFSFLHITYQQKTNNSLAFLLEAELHTSFLNIRQNLELYGIASVIREFLLIAVKEGEPDIRIFRLSLWALHHLDRKQPPKTVLTLFLIQFFDYVGYRPGLESCVNCHAQVARHDRYIFDPISGGVICSTCNPRLPRGLPLSHGTIKMLQSAQDQPLDRLHRLKISGSILKEALSLLHSYGQQLFQRDIVSWRLLQKMSAGT
jgi:DNA repair protein RecO (recombination protein O)